VAGSLSTFRALKNGACFNYYNGEHYSFQFVNLTAYAYIDANCVTYQLQLPLDQECSYSDDDGTIPDGTMARQEKERTETTYYDYYGYGELPTSKLYGLWSMTNGGAIYGTSNPPTRKPTSYPTTKNIETYDWSILQVC
jgi:hypothetical protein